MKNALLILLTMILATLPTNSDASSSERKKAVAAALKHLEGNYELQPTTNVVDPAYPDETYRLGSDFCGSGSFIFAAKGAKGMNVTGEVEYALYLYNKKTLKLGYANTYDGETTFLLDPISPFEWTISSQDDRRTVRREFKLKGNSLVIRIDLRNSGVQSYEVHALCEYRRSPLL